MGTLELAKSQEVFDGPLLYKKATSKEAKALSSAWKRCFKADQGLNKLKDLPEFAAAMHHKSAKMSRRLVYNWFTISFVTLRTLLLSFLK